MLDAVAVAGGAHARSAGADQTIAGKAPPDFRRDAVIGSIAYLVSVAVVVYAQFAIQGKLIVAGQPSATAQNILANESQFRLALVFDLVFCLGTVISAGAYYVILERFDRGIAMVSAVARLAYGAAWMLATIRLADALRIVKAADYLGAVGVDRLNALAQLRLAGRGDDYYLGLPFWAISATLLAYLWWKSGYLPRPFAMAGIIASAWAVFCAFAYLVAPSFSRIVNLWWFDSPMALFELGVAVWLLVKRLPPREAVG